jgi:hypothetical protein
LPGPPGSIIAAYEPSVAMKNGNIAVAWTDIFGDALPTYPKLVAGRTLTFANAPGSGAPAGSDEFFIDNPYNPYPQDPETGGNYPLQQSHTSVAMSSDGLTYVVAYAENSLAIYFDPDPYRMNVFARVFAIDPNFPPATGPTTPGIMVNTTVAGNQYAPDVAMDAAGDFVVAWVSAPAGGWWATPVPQDGDGAGVFARAFAYSPATGLGPASGEFQVNQTYLNDQTLPAIAMSDSGTMTVAWQSYDPTDANGDGIPDNGWDVYSRRYSVTF